MKLRWLGRDIPSNNAVLLIPLCILLSICSWLNARRMTPMPGVTRAAKNQSIPHETSTSNAPTTVLVMSDSRSLDVDDYHRLALTINAHFAKLHNYSIRFVHTPCINSNISDISTDDKDQTKECIACRHAQQGGRSSPWCKLLAINDTLHHPSKWDRLVYIDSDAFVNLLHEPLPDHYFTKTLNMFASAGEFVPCSGIQFWKNTARARRQIMPLWWDSNKMDGHFNTHHDYEQSVFHRDGNESELLQAHKTDIGVFIEGVREYSRIADKEFFRHITHKGEGVRYQRMQQFIQQHNVSMDLSRVDMITLQQ